ncbi:hypothetical protein CLV91_2368 [Maribacter vaceletii]|uniref:Uncharacterized protein n=1 Tax=Maribacter vaceletii TaxID=1206816 RepID=A0A495E5M9_9FLAO|nr:hypothetical protein CLV91_2368 [Maribacter vaceletii]
MIALLIVISVVFVGSLIFNYKQKRAALRPIKVPVENKK